LLDATSLFGGGGTLLAVQLVDDVPDLVGLDESDRFALSAGCSHGVLLLRLMNVS
jgi:hypothetical protein